ncbi:hypothetical protein BC941DRAFT_476655 [Chlamydoabsidia padenii]|nr:hypothetical protein BC941DRAFT_476655 [Chlamydoabsidia padenii]
MVFIGFFGSIIYGVSMGAYALLRQRVLMAPGDVGKVLGLKSSSNNNTSNMDQDNNSSLGTKSHDMNIYADTIFITQHAATRPISTQATERLQIDDDITNGDPLDPLAAPSKKQQFHKTATQKKLDHTVLCSADDLFRLRNETSWLQFCGKGHKLMWYYRLWASKLYSRFNSADFITQVMKASSNKQYKVTHVVKNSSDGIDTNSNDKDDASSDNNDTSDDDDMDDMDAPPLFMKAAPVTQPLITTTMPELILHTVDILMDQSEADLLKHICPLITVFDYAKDVTLTDEHLCDFTTGWKILRQFPVWHEDKSTGWIPELGGIADTPFLDQAFTSLLLFGVPGDQDALLWAAYRYYMDGNQLVFGSFGHKSLGKRSLQQIYENNGVPDKFPSDSKKPFHTPTINIKDSPVLALAASVKVLGDLYTTYWIY